MTKRNVTPPNGLTVEEFNATAQRILAEVARVLVGQETLVRQLLITLLAGGNALLEGVPGLGKTLLVRTLAQVVEGGFSRIQFTPDLMPADIVGTMVLSEDEAGRRSFRFEPGPVFANLLLADEINRATPRTQSALLEAMQERQVTIGETSYPLPEPFMVLATQNPVEQEGTYSLPEAQVDRFMLKLKVDYPTREQELEILRRMAKSAPGVDVQALVEPSDILRLRRLSDEIYIDPKVEEYIVSVVEATRKPSKYGLQLDHLIRYGGSPRATIFLAMASKAHALLDGRGYVTPQDVKSIAWDVLRHRVVVTYEAEAEEKTPEDIIQAVLDAVEVP
jgi:MoxR-like ATPase